MIDMTMITRLSDALEVYKQKHYPLDLTETEIEVLQKGLLALEIIYSHEGDGRK